MPVRDDKMEITARSPRVELRDRSSFFRAENFDSSTPSLVLRPVPERLRNEIASASLSA